MHYELFIALRHIKSRHRQTALSIGAIGIAVMIIVFSNAFMTGFTEELYSSTVDNLPHVTISPEEGEEHIHLYRNLMAQVNGIEGVVATSPSLEGEASFRYKGNTQNAYIKGIIPENEDAVLHTSEDMVHGDLFELACSKNTIIIGDDLAEELNVDVTDVVDISFPAASPLSLTVVGIYDTGLPVDKVLTYTSLTTAQDFYDTSNVINSMSVRLEDYNEDVAIASTIKEKGYSASGWTATNPEILQTIAIEGTGNNIMLGFILLIACFGVVSTLNMVVLEKTKEIGILMAMGAKVSSIRKIFILESGILGLLGATAGTSLGALMAMAIGSYPVPADVYGIDSIPVAVYLSDVLLTISVVFLLNLLAGTYPAHHAAKLDPVESIATR